MSANTDPREAAARPGPGASPHRAPWCGARTRAGSPCLGLAMANGRCPAGQARGQAPHGGASTGPRTAAGLARLVAAKTTHGGYAMSGAPARQAQRCVRTLIVRIGLTCTATRLRAYLPAVMAARLNAAPEELKAPKHPSQVAFEALHATTPYNCLPTVFGLGRRARAARARLEAGGELADGTAAVALRGRQTERLAAQAPWRAAIAAARGAKRAAREARRQTRNARNDPMRGATVGAQTRNPRNDPMRGAPVRPRVAAAGAPVDAPLEVPAGRRAGDGVAWAPGSPGWGEALAREVMARRLRAEFALRGNDPMRGPEAGAGPGTKQPGGGARVARKAPPLGSTRGLALGSTTLARTWAPSMAEILAAQFGPAAPVGWLGASEAPKGIAPMPSGDCAQRPHTGTAMTKRVVRRARTSLQPRLTLTRMGPSPHSSHSCGCRTGPRRAPMVPPGFCALRIHPVWPRRETPPWARGERQRPWPASRDSVKNMG
jgi:hypothetical protein